MTTLELTAAWRERRQEVRDLCAAVGKDYASTVGPSRAVLLEATTQTGLGVVRTVLALARKVPALSPVTGALLLAAALDLIEEGAEP